MATIGYVTKRDDGRYEGELKTLSVRASIATSKPVNSVRNALIDITWGLLVRVGRCRDGRGRRRGDNRLVIT